MVKLYININKSSYNIKQYNCIHISIILFISLFIQYDFYNGFLCYLFYYVNKIKTKCIFICNTFLIVVIQLLRKAYILKSCYF